MLDVIFDYFANAGAREYSVMFKMILGLAAGYAIGYERERAKKTAGVRTHMIVCMITAGVIAASEESSFALDAGVRVVSAVVTGIGFLGAGQIMNSGGKLSGVTTAAAMWGSALMGCIIGLGFYISAFCGTTILLFIFRMKKENGEHDTNSCHVKGH